MKKFVDFESRGPLGRVVNAVIGPETADSAEEADIVLVDSEDKVLHYLQQTQKKVVQICIPDCHPMIHLLEDYPSRLRVADVRKRASMLVPILTAISELTENS